MSKWRHRLTNINTDQLSGDCMECGKNIELYAYKSASLRCKKARFQQAKLKYKYRKFFIKSQLSQCAQCEIVSDDKRFFDVDHIDNNHKNNIESNLQVLCPNCHRKKTLKNIDNMKNNYISQFN